MYNVHVYVCISISWQIHLANLGSKAPPSTVPSPRNKELWPRWLSLEEQHWAQLEEPVRAVNPTWCNGVGNNQVRSLKNPSVPNLGAGISRIFVEECIPTLVRNLNAEQGSSHHAYRVCLKKRGWHQIPQDWPKWVVCKRLCHQQRKTTILTNQGGLFRESDTIILSEKVMLPIKSHKTGL